VSEPWVVGLWSQETSWRRFILASRKMDSPRGGLQNVSDGRYLVKDRIVGGAMGVAVFRLADKPQR
jgi:hypothetical protein